MLKQKKGKDKSMKNILQKAKELVELLEMEIEKEGKVDASGILLSELKPGEVFKTDIGEFIVLEQEDGQTKVITRGLYKEDVVFGSDTDYKESSLRKLCDNEIRQDFERMFGAENIIVHKVDLTTLDNQTDFGSIECKVRPLTFEEARKFNDMLTDEDLPDWWWTCTPWSTPERGWKYGATVVSPRGGINYYSCNGSIGVRPFCILKSNIFVSKGE